MKPSLPTTYIMTVFILGSENEPYNIYIYTGQSCFVKELMIESLHLRPPDIIFFVMAKPFQVLFQVQ